MFYYLFCGFCVCVYKLYKCVYLEVNYNGYFIDIIKFLFLVDIYYGLIVNSIFWIVIKIILVLVNSFFFYLVLLFVLVGWGFYKIFFVM